MNAAQKTHLVECVGYWMLGVVTAIIGSWTIHNGGDAVEWAAMFAAVGYITNRSEFRRLGKR